MILLLLSTLCLLAAVWFGFPYTGVLILSTVWVRAAVMGGILALMLVIALLRFLRRRRAAKALEAALIPEVPEGDGKVLAERMNAALAKLKAKGGATYLYDLPWYVIIGPPGAGKTTALVNSGLKFPLGGETAGLEGFGGTRYCDWWFAEDAVLIDTAGRYTTQDSNAAADGASWQSFLNLLKTSRPKQPVNGVILSFSVEDLMQASEASLARHAETVRARLAEVHETLKIDFPVYVLFTKADLIAGFREFVAPFSLERRNAVWGTTFQTRDRRALTHDIVPAEFDRLVAKLSDEVTDRLTEEPDGLARIAIFGLPGQMAMLRGAVEAFLRQVFAPTNYKTSAILRGFYFTSGTQEGTPFDQVLGAMSRIGEGAGTGFAPRFMSGQGKSFFLHDLLSQVIFAERDWVSYDRRAVRRAGFFRGTAMLLITLAMLGAMGAFGYSYWQNASLVRFAAIQAQTYERTASEEIRREVIADVSLQPIIGLLNEIRAMPAGYDQTIAPDLWETFGLGQRRRLEQAGIRSYSDALEKMLRPRMILALENALPFIERDGNTTDIYRALKVYMLLGKQAQRSDDETILTYFNAQWRAAFGGQGRAGAVLVDDLMRHLEAMLELDDDRDLLVDIRTETIESARAAIAELSPVDQAYALIMDQASGSGLPDWEVLDRVGPASAQVLAARNGADLSAVRIPGVFTYEGYWSFFAPQLEAVGARLKRDQWIFGDSAYRTDMEAQIGGLDLALKARYRDDFVAVWQGMLGNLTLASMSADAPRYDALGTAASPGSPLLYLTREIDLQTRMSRGQDGAVSAPILDIEAAFGGWRDMLVGATGQRPIDQVLGNLGSVYNTLRLAAASPEQAEGLLPEALNTLIEGSSDWPPTLAGLVDEVEAEFRAGTNNATLEQMNRALNNEITFFCKVVITSSFPFARSSSPVALDDFTRFFGPGGDMERFYEENLAQFVKRTPEGLLYDPESAMAGRLAPATLLQFERAERIRLAFFAGGDAPSVDISVAHVDSSEGVAQARLVLNEVALVSAPGDAPTLITWPGQGRASSVELLPQVAGQENRLQAPDSDWSFLNLLNAASSRLQSGDSLKASFVIGGRSVTYDFTINGVNPFTMRELAEFACPESLD